MSTATIRETGLYLYGITLASESKPALPPGIAGGSVEIVREGPLAAVITRLGAEKIRAQRANLAAHHQVLRDLAAHQPVLPVAFGTMADDFQHLREILQRNRSRLVERLRVLEGTLEMTLKVFWETANIFEFFVGSNQELEQMRNRLFRPGKRPTFEEKLELGKTFEMLIEENRRGHTDRVTEALAPYCLEIRSMDCSEERMIMKLACLVKKDRLGEWEKGIEETARLFDNHYSFQYSGPWAPYNFAEVDLEPA
jgi:hypothetical protein